MRRIRWVATFATLTVMVVLIGLAAVWVLHGSRTTPAAYPAWRVTEGREAGEDIHTDPPARAPFDRTRHSTTDPRSIWVVVNKKHPVEPGFRPDITLVRGYQVATAAAGPLARLLEAGDQRGLGLKIASAYRSYGYQSSVYQSTVAARGAAAADRVSARPGHSEHQTGLGVDIVTPADAACHFERCFGDSPAGRWLAREAWRFGFIVRYPPGAKAITGYAPEPWHLRYVGRPLAAELRKQQVATLEEFFDVAGGDYD